MQLNWANENDARDQPPTITLDIAEDADSLRLWFSWAELSPAVRKRLVSIAEREAKQRLQKTPHLVS
jgi:hypothetical protein